MDHSHTEQLATLPPPHQPSPRDTLMFVGGLIVVPIAFILGFIIIAFTAVGHL